jgi:hypothetical protein
MVVRLGADRSTNLKWPNPSCSSNQLADNGDLPSSLHEISLIHLTNRSSSHTRTDICIELNFGTA